MQRIAAGVDELARARRAADLGAAAALPDRRAERRRRSAKPDLDFREFCRRSKLPQSERSWDLLAAERYRRGEPAPRLMRRTTRCYQHPYRGVRKSKVPDKINYGRLGVRSNPCRASVTQSGINVPELPLQSRVSVHDRIMSLPVHPLAGQRVGYARISSASQNLAGQTDALTAAGCEKVFADTASGKLAERPELALCLGYLRPGTR